MRLTFIAALLACGIFSVPVAAQRLDIQPEIQIENRFFFEDPGFPDQFRTFQGGLILTGDLRWTSKDRNTRIQFEPYLRLDTQDAERSYFDVREAAISRRYGDWDVLLGAGQVFWGVAESRNVVDIINQFDTVEDFDQGEKLGQPLVRVSKRGNFGTLEAYYLPFFRKQRFIGQDGRLRFDPIIDGDDETYERSGEEWAGDVAFRYSNRFGGFDLGLHVFYGTSRDPLLIPNEDASAFTPFYQERVQGGVDLQYTSGSWLLKLEATGVNQGGDTFLSSVAGFEYTFFDVGGRGIDLGLIGEYLYDNRDLAQTPITLFENDAFAGARLTFNDVQDTELLAGAIIDTETGGVIASVEFQRRIGAAMVFEIEGRAFRGGDDPFVGAFSQDSHVTFRLTRFF